MKLRSTLTPCWFVVAIATCTGCIVTTSQHRALEERVVAMERADAELRQQLAATMERASQQIAALNEQLEQAHVQTRSLADLGARMSGIDAQVREVSGAVAEVRHTIEALSGDQNAQRNSVVSTLSSQVTTLERRIGELERRTGVAPVLDPNQIPATPNEIMVQARQSFGTRDFNRARALANAVIERAPQDALADDARLLIGKCHASENRNATAVQEFNRLITDYPSADTVPEAMREMAEAFVRLGLCTSAQRTLRLLVERFGTTPHAGEARRRIDEVRRMPRAACTG